MDNDAVHFRARFNGVSREIYIPVHNVLAIYANENGQGMAFEVGALPAASSDGSAPEVGTAPAGPALSAVPSKGVDSPVVPDTEVSAPPSGGDDEPPKKGGRPTLTRIK